MLDEPQPQDGNRVDVEQGGADDYVVKPVATSVLLQRVRSLLRRLSQFNHAATKEILGGSSSSLDRKWSSFAAHQ